MNNIKEVLLYILDTEFDNYVNFCIENNLDKDDYLNNNHIYSKACLAWDLEYRGEK